MVKELFFCLCSIHVLGDFYLQSPKMAEEKKAKWQWILLHLAIYAISSIVLFQVLLPGVIMGYRLLFVVSHGVIDILKYLICHYKLKNQRKYIVNDSIVLILDQMLHIAILTYITYKLRDMGILELFNNEVAVFLHEANISGRIVLIWGLRLLLIHKPTNVLISTILKPYRTDKNQEESDKNAGRFIGTLERLIMIILMTIEQYSAVGLVLTAKSIARYNKISEKQEFAEYYLLGTLLSTLCAITLAVLLRV